MQIALNAPPVIEFPPAPAKSVDRLAAVLLEQRRSGSSEFPPGTYLFATLADGSPIRGLCRFRKLRPSAETRQHY